MTISELKAKSLVELRLIAKTAPFLITGTSNRVLDSETAILYLSGQISIEDAMARIYNATQDQEVRTWIEKRFPQGGTAPQVPKKEEIIPPPTPKAPPVPQAPEPAKAPAKEYVDPRTNPNWATACGAFKLMGFDIDEMMRVAIDDKETQITELMAELEAAKRRNVPTHEDADDWGVDPAFQWTQNTYDLLKLVEQGRNVLLAGLHGTGKTMSIRAVAKKMQRRLIIIEGHGHMMVDSLEGETYLDIDEASGKSIMVHLPGIIQKALEASAIFVVDELDKMPPAAQHLMNNVVQNRALTIKQGKRSGETIRGGEGFLVVGTVNSINGSQNGYMSNPLDKSSLSRFRVLEFDYDTKAERRILEAKAIPAATIDTIQKAVKINRTMFKANDVPAVVSTRQIKALAEDLAEGWTLAQAWDLNCARHAGLSFEQAFKDVQGAMTQATSAA